MRFPGATEDIEDIEKTVKRMRTGDNRCHLPSVFIVLMVLIVFIVFNISIMDIRLLAKVHLLAKIALFGISLTKFFDHMFPYALKILSKIYSKMANFFKQSNFCKKSIFILVFY